MRPSATSASASSAAWLGPQASKTSLADPDWWLDAWGDACLQIAEQTGIGFDTLPSDCPWTADQILDPGFWPDAD